MSITEIAWKSKEALTTHEAKTVVSEWGKSGDGIAMVAILARSAPETLLLFKDDAYTQDMADRLRDVSPLDQWKHAISRLSQAVDAMMAGQIPAMLQHIREATNGLQRGDEEKFNQVLADALRERFATAPIFRDRPGWREHT